MLPTPPRLTLSLPASFHFPPRIPSLLPTHLAPFCSILSSHPPTPSPSYSLTLTLLLPHLHPPTPSPSYSLTLTLLLPLPSASFLQESAAAGDNYRIRTRCHFSLVEGSSPEDDVYVYGYTRAVSYLFVGVPSLRGGRVCSSQWVCHHHSECVITVGMSLSQCMYPHHSGCVLITVGVSSPQWVCPPHSGGCHNAYHISVCIHVKILCLV